MALKIPARVTANALRTPEGAAWLERLPGILARVERQWSLTVGGPFDAAEGNCAWVAPVTLADGTSAVLKLGMPHLESEHEIQGLRFWNGEPTVRLMDAAEDLGAMLLERCEPGTSLRAIPEPEQDWVIAGLLRQLWRAPSLPHPFRPLSMLMKRWSDETLAQVDRWPDTRLIGAGLRLFEQLPGTAPTKVLLATDVHAGNVLQSKRKPWLVIDPKPFIGDPAYDATQHLFNCEARLRADPHGMISRMADLLGVSYERIRLWTFARAAAEPRNDWNNEGRTAIAKATAP